MELLTILLGIACVWLLIQNGRLSKKIKSITWDFEVLSYTSANVAHAIVEAKDGNNPLPPVALLFLKQPVPAWFADVYVEVQKNAQKRLEKDAAK